MFVKKNRMKKIIIFVLHAVALLFMITSTAVYAAEQGISRQNSLEPGKKIFSVPAWVSDIKIRSFLTVKEEYNDNVNFTVADRKSDWISYISPGLELFKKTERMDAVLSASLNGIYYIDQHDLNAWDQFYNGKFHYTLNEKLGVGGSAGFTRDSQPTRDIETTGVIFPEGVIRERQNYSATGDWRMTEQSTAGFFYNYAKDRYNQSTSSDLESQTVGFNLTNSFNETTSGTLNFSYVHNLQTATTMDNYNSTIGINKVISNTWSILVNAGVVYTHSQYTNLISEQTNNDWGPMGQVGITYNHDENTSGNLTISRSVTPVTGTTSSSNRTSFVISMRRQFTSEWSGNISGAYIINKSDPGEFSNTGVDQNTTTASIGSRYNFNKDIFLMASYTYQRIDYRQTDTNAEQHLVMLTLNIQYTFFE